MITYKGTKTSTTNVTNLIKSTTGSHTYTHIFVRSLSEDSIVTRINHYGRKTRRTISNIYKDEYDKCMKMYV